MTASLWHYITMINVGKGRGKRGVGGREEVKRVKGEGERGREEGKE